MKSADYRSEARSSLQGKWGKGAFLVLGYLGVNFLISFVLGFVGETIASLITTIIGVPLQLGFIISLFKLFNDETVGVFDFVNQAISNFGRSWSITWHMILKLLLPAIILIVSFVLMVMTLVNGNNGLTLIMGVIMIIDSIYFTMKSYYYQLAYVVAADNPEMSGAEAVEKSEILMQGKRLSLFFLQLSFIGWAILGTLTLCIGYLWLIPYMQFATFAFYKNALNANG